MKLEKKHYWMIGTAAVLITAGVIIYKVNKKKKAEAAASGGDGNNQFVEDVEYEEASASEEAAEMGLNNSSVFPLQFGSENESVASVQKYMNSTCPSDLKKAGVFPLLIDGKWGEQTDTAALACGALKRNKIDKESFERIARDLLAANIQ